MSTINPDILMRYLGKWFDSASEIIWALWKLQGKSYDCNVFILSLTLIRRKMSPSHVNWTI
jgi:hypothetical protein